MKQRWLWLGLFLVGLLGFLFSRFWLLPPTLYFWGDIGRDHEVLMEMVQDRRPVFLGPSNSELPFNQSAWYFYLNLPIFVVAHFSAFSTAITGVLFTVGAFCFVAYELTDHWKKWPALGSLTIFSLLFAWQPLFLAQQRSTWNPAFALPFILVALVLAWRWWKKLPQFWEVAVFSGSLAMALGMTYAAAPAAMALSVWTLWRFSPPARKQLIALLFLSLLVVFLPHLIFEVRHHFLLTSQLLHFAGHQETEPLLSKLVNGWYLLFGFREKTPAANLAIGMASIGTLLGVRQTSIRDRKKLLAMLVFFLASFLVSVPLVSAFHSHYALIPGLILLFLVSRLPVNWQAAVAVILLWAWLPLDRGEFTRQPHRTVADLEACAQLVCQDHPEPMYVAAQAWHSFHSGYDYSFFLNKHGCRTRDIGTHLGYSNTLAVVVDQSQLDAKTDFYELSLFGSRQEMWNVSCGHDLSVHGFSRADI